MILWSRKRSRFNERINEKLTDQPASQTAIRVSCTLLSVKRNEIIKYPCLQSSPFWISVNFHFPLFYSVNTKLLLSYHAFCNIFVGNWATFCKWWLICCGGVVSMFLEWFPTMTDTCIWHILSRILRAYSKQTLFAIQIGKWSLHQLPRDRYSHLKALCVVTALKGIIFRPLSLL